MKNFLMVSLAAVFAFEAAGQKVIHDANAEVRTVKSFHAVEVSNGIDLYLSEGEEAVAVSAKDNESRNRITTEVENGVLKISYKWKDIRGWSGNHNLKAYVSYKALDQLAASGGADIKLESLLKAKNLVLQLSGGSDFKGKVQAENISVEISGGSDVDMNGSAGNMSIEASGGSDFKGFEMVADKCSAEASGGSDIKITVSKEFSASASGGSDINYKGNPGKVELDKSISGSIKKVG